MGKPFGEASRRTFGRIGTLVPFPCWNSLGVMSSDTLKFSKQPPSEALKGGLPVSVLQLSGILKEDMAKKIVIQKIIKALGVLLIIFSVTATVFGQDLAESRPQTPEVMPGGPPIPLIAIPEDFFFRVLQPPEVLSLFEATATFSINYISSGTNIFGDACTPWPIEAQNAFNYAAGVWATYLQSSVPITINGCWATNLSPGVLGHSGSTNFYRNFSGAPVTNTWYAVSLANALSGSDLDPSNPDIEIAYSSTFNWYFGTDGHPGSGQYDFVSVVMHEIAHGLGFSGSMNVSSGQGSWGGGTSYPIAYDRFTENGSGQSLINISLFPNPSASLAAQLTSSNLYFDGPHANAANGGSRAKLYAPGTWDSGSSYSHLDEIYDGTVNALMTYSLNSAEAIHVPGPITMGILTDVGWSTSSCTYSIYPTSQSFTASGGIGSVNVTTQSGCSWIATSGASWITITSGSSGTGNGTVSYSVAATTSSRTGAMTIAGQTFTVTQSGPGGGGYVPCDFNGDGKTDILWRNKSIGQNVVWFMNGAAFSSYSWIDTVADTNWQIVGTGDFNSDGKTDILWRNKSTGQNAVWFMNGAALSSYSWIDTVADTNWQIVGTGDFNGDGKTDILWRNKSTGQNVLWFMNGAAFSSYSWIDTVADTNWQIVGTGDFTGDGKPDILWRNKSTGQNVLWFMNGAVYSSYAELMQVTDMNWQIVGTGDFNGDGKTDILWRNKSTGQNVVWYMNGATYSRYAELMQVTDTNWEIVGPK